MKEIVAGSFFKVFEHKMAGMVLVRRDEDEAGNAFISVEISYKDAICATKSTFDDEDARDKAFVTRTLSNHRALVNRMVAMIAESKD